MSVINTNVKSLVARDSLTINNRALSTAMERLSTGKRINSAADDAAGLSISTRMEAQVRGLNMAIKNANDAISVTQTAEGAMQEVNSILQRMRELSVQSANVTNNDQDRSFLQAEVSQLSQEIDRIAGTTQFNGINVLDGSFKNKNFQIGSNAGQTMALSIGSMKSSVLGVASGTTSASSPAPVTTNVISDAAAKGTAADPTVIKLGFTDNDEYAFDLKDDVSGITTSFSATELDLTSSVSKRDFLTDLNKAIRESGVATKLTAGVAWATTNIDADHYDDFKFSVSVGSGPTQSIDLRSRLIANGATTNATLAQVKTAMETELQALYGEGITVGDSASKLTVTDAEGRRIVISQGAGSGALFGTDASNDGALTVDATTASNLTASWNGNDLVITNSAGGKTSISNYVATDNSAVKFDVVKNGQANQVDPIYLSNAAYSDNAVVAAGGASGSSFALALSNTSDTYKFKITDGEGHVLANLSAGIDATDSASDIIAQVTTALSSGLALLHDSTLTADEFNVNFSGNVLSITSRNGRAMAIENFSTTAGSTATFTPTSQLGTSNLLSPSRVVDPSTAHLALKSEIEGAKLDSFDAKFNLKIDNGDLAELDMTDVTKASGWTWEDFAAKMQSEIRASTTAKDSNGVLVDVNDISVTYDTGLNQILVTDKRGRSITVNDDASTEQAYLIVADVTQVASTARTIGDKSSVVKGQVTQQSTLSFTLGADKATFNFKLNGVSLTSNEWDTTKSVTGTDLQADLDTLIKTLNDSHPGDPFSYAISGKTITFYQKDGGALELSDYDATGNTNVTATVSPGAGQGSERVIAYHAILDNASATGNVAVATQATLKLTGDDVYSLSISDGTNTYSLANTALNINDSSSTANFAEALNEALVGSSIKASLDTKGNLFLSNSTGGEVYLTSFTSALGRSATWTPKAGQGDAFAVDGSGAISASGETSESTLTVTQGAGSSVAQISIATQAGASKALSVIDAALNYVNNERSKLGAVENRLTHTIDNLTNIVTNTSASKSRILDTDYATETTELARTQIIQQAATAMLAQANQSAQSVLALLK